MMKKLIMLKKSFTFCIIFVFLIPLLPAGLLKSLYKSGRIILVPQLVISNSTLPRENLLVYPVQTIRDCKGNYHISDMMMNNVKLINSSGKFLKVYGRIGKGPGDFNSPMFITSSSDWIYIWDHRNNRISKHDLIGKFVDSLVLSFQYGMVDKIKFLKEGYLVVGRKKMYYGTSEPQKYFIDIYTEDFRFVKTIFSCSLRLRKFMTDINRQIIRPFPTNIHWDVSINGSIVFGISNEYRIFICNPIENVTENFVHPGKKVKVSEDDKKRFFNSISYSVNGKIIKKGLDKNLGRKTEFPQYKPFFYNLITDGEGNILVFFNTTQYSSRGRIFDAFEPNGKYIGRVEIKGKGKLIDSKYISVFGDNFISIDRNENEEPIVVISRVSRYKS